MVMLAPRLYNSSKKEALVDAVPAVRGGISIRPASEEFDVRKSTLHDRGKNVHAKEPGRPCELDDRMEKTLAKLIDVLAEWGYLLGGFKIKMMVKNFLDTKGEVSAVFSNNLPGNRWLKAFAKRCQMSASVASNIRRARAMISQDIVNEFFDELVAAVGDTPPEKIFNFDETNFTDDPGMKKCVVRLVARHVEMIHEHSKTAISEMWCE